MMIPLAAVLLGVILGLACGGSIYPLSEVRLRHEWLVLVLFVVQAVARGRALGTGTSAALPVWVISSGLLVGVLFLNYRRPGLLVVAAGVLVNLDVVLLNHGMPVFLTAAEQSSVSGPLPLQAATHGFYRELIFGTVAPSMGDVLRLRVMGRVLAVSPGDILLAVGVTICICALMLASTEEGEAPASPSNYGVLALAPPEE